MNSHDFNVALCAIDTLSEKLDQAQAIAHLLSITGDNNPRPLAVAVAANLVDDLLDVVKSNANILFECAKDPAK